MSRPLKNNLGVSLPCSSEIIGAVVKALDLDHGVQKGAEILEGRRQTVGKRGIVTEPAKSDT